VSSTAKPIDVSVWRSGGDGAFEGFEVPAQENQTILDVVAWIQQNADPTLAYRFACRVGMCGSCAMMVNGMPRWTCRTHVQKVLDGNKLEIAPLRNLPVIKDLATDMDPFFEKWVKAEGVFHPSKSRDDGIEQIDPSSAERTEADTGIECKRSNPRRCLSTWRLSFLSQHGKLCAGMPERVEPDGVNCRIKARNGEVIFQAE